MERGAIIGIDLSQDYIQISYIDDSKNIISMSVSDRNEPYMIPAVMFYNTDIKVWSMGIEAENKSRVEKGIFISDILAKISAGQHIGEDEICFSSQEVMKALIAGIFAIVKSYCKVYVEKAVVSIENTEGSLMELVSGALEDAGLSEDDYRIISHSESFIYYTLSQNSDIWINNVIMVDLNENRCIYKKLFATKGRRPLIAEVTESDISDIVSMDMLDTEDGRYRMDNEFCRFMTGRLAGNVVSSIFLTGRGFDTNWFPKTMNAIRGNRRIFKGYNMISKGSGFAAREMFVKETLGEYVFSCPGRIQVNVYLEVEQNGHEKFVQLAKAGDNWYQAGASFECIVNRTDIMKLVIQSPVTRETRNVFISLRALPKRPDKATRIGIKMAFTDDSTFVINVRDMGFGEFFEASDVEIKEVVRADTSWQD